jgi:dTDP-4-dehydrorhamnose reductase
VWRSFNENTQVMEMKIEFERGRETWSFKMLGTPPAPPETRERGNDKRSLGYSVTRPIDQLEATETYRTVVDDQVGSPTFTADLAPALRRLAETGQYGLYHVTNEGSCSWYAFAREAVALLASRFPDLSSASIRPMTTEQLGRPAPRPFYSVLRNYNLELAGLPRLRPYTEALRDFVQALDFE